MNHPYPSLAYVRNSRGLDCIIPVVLGCRWTDSLTLTELFICFFDVLRCCKGSKEWLNQTEEVGVFLYFVGFCMKKYALGETLGHTAKNWFPLFYFPPHVPSAPCFILFACSPCYFFSPQIPFFLERGKFSSELDQHKRSLILQKLSVPWAGWNTREIYKFNDIQR